MKYANRTKVPVGQSKADIEHAIVRYGATGFISGWHSGHGMISFEMVDRRVRFLLPLSDEKDAAGQQENRQKWRALLLCIKAKLESVETGIETFEEAFLAHIVMKNDLTIGEAMLPRLPEAVSSGKLPPLLPSPKGEQ